MNEVGSILGIMAIVIVVLSSILIRFLIAPRHRNEFLEELLESMTEPEPADRMSRTPHASVALDDSLAENLLRHFEQSATSRHVLAALTSRTAGMPESEVVTAVNRELAHRRKRELPAAVVRKVVMILMGADLAALRQGRLELTTAGKRLHALLQARSIESPRTAAFASP